MSLGYDPRIGKQKRMLELAAMLKEKGSGNEKDLKKILARFSIQEGLRAVVVDEYLDKLQESGLVVVTPGMRKWRYNPEEEYENFTVPIEDDRTTS
jgi:hypothetical protein